MDRIQHLAHRIASLANVKTVSIEYSRYSSPDSWTWAVWYISGGISYRWGIGSATPLEALTKAQHEIIFHLKRNPARPKYQKLPTEKLCPDDWYKLV